jgi:hypothetical protein
MPAPVTAGKMVVGTTMIVPGGAMGRKNFVDSYTIKEDLFLALQMSALGPHFHNENASASSVNKACLIEMPSLQSIPCKRRSLS